MKKLFVVLGIAFALTALTGCGVVDNNTESNAVEQTVQAYLTDECKWFDVSNVEVTGVTLSQKDGDTLAQVKFDSCGRTMYDWVSMDAIDNYR